MSRIFVLALAAAAALMTASLAGAFNPDVLVTNGSPPSPFSQNKQNEPALAVDANHPNVLVAGAERQHRHGGVQRRGRQHLPVHPGRRRLGRLLLVRLRHHVDAADLHGLERAQLPRAPSGPTPAAPPQVGPIGTLPWYYENGLVSDGDPAVAFGPRPGADGTSRWANGSRLYYANLTVEPRRHARRRQRSRASRRSRSRGRTTSQAAAAGTQDRLDAAGDRRRSRCRRRRSPTRSRSGPTTRRSSPFFGTVYVCWASFRGQETGRTPLPRRCIVGVSHDGGDTWSAAPDHGRGEQRPAKPDRRLHDPHGQQRQRLRVRHRNRLLARARSAFELMSVSTNGGSDWSTGSARRRAGHAAGRHRPGARPAGDRRRRGRAERPRAGAERRHRERRPDRRGRDQPDRDDLRQRRARDAARLLHRVDRRRRHMVDAAGDRDRGRPWLSTPHRRSRRTARTSTSSTTRSRRRISHDTHAPRALVGVVLHADTRRRPGRPAPSPSCIAALRVIRAGRARTTSRASSSATTSTR